MNQEEINKLMLKVLQTMSESQARWFVAKEALARGRGGISAMHALTGISRPTIIKGIRELKESEVLSRDDRIRKAGAGRKRIEQLNPGFTATLERIMEKNTQGSPEALLRWTNNSIPLITEELVKQGYALGADAVRHRLHELGYTIQMGGKSTAEELVGRKDKQYRYINHLASAVLASGDPVISLECHRGRLPNLQARKVTWRVAGQEQTPDIEESFDFNEKICELAVESLHRWWRWIGLAQHPTATRFLLCTNVGGNAARRNHTWTALLWQMAKELKKDVVVAHYPPGTCRWDRVEHRLTSTINLSGPEVTPLNGEIVVGFLGPAYQQLETPERFDWGEYESEEVVSAEAKRGIVIVPHRTQPIMNYSLIVNEPKQPFTTPPPTSMRAVSRRQRTTQPT